MEYIEATLHGNVLSFRSPPSSSCGPEIVVARTSVFGLALALGTGLRSRWPSHC